MLSNRPVPQDLHLRVARSVDRQVQLQSRVRTNLKADSPVCIPRGKARARTDREGIGDAMWTDAT